MIRRPLRPSLKPIPRYTPLRPRGAGKAKRTERYKKYLASKAWREMRDAVIARAQGYCERCGAPFGDGKIVAHHRTYIRLYAERLTDLEAICVSCDNKIHGNEMWRLRHRRGAVDFGMLAAFTLVALIAFICGCAIGWDHACTKVLPVGTYGMDQERSTATATAKDICISEAEWRDGMTVLCARELAR